MDINGHKNSPWALLLSGELNRTDDWLNVVVHFVSLTVKQIYETPHTMVQDHGKYVTWMF